MRGQRLFVRPIETPDHEQVRAFLQSHRGHSSVPACGLLGKLLGDLVAVVAIQITTEAVLIDDIVVARGLRRKRIGRVMLLELEQIASKIDRPQLIVEGDPEAQEFLRRVGFEREGIRWVKKVQN